MLSEAFEFFNDFVAAGDMEMHTAGSLQDGKIVEAVERDESRIKLSAQKAGAPLRLDAEVLLVAVGAYQLQQAQQAARRLTDRGVPTQVTYLLEPARFRSPRSAGEAAHRQVQQLPVDALAAHVAVERREGRELGGCACGRGRQGEEEGEQDDERAHANH